MVSAVIVAVTDVGLRAPSPSHARLGMGVAGLEDAEGFAVVQEVTGLFTKSSSSKGIHRIQMVDEGI